MSTLPNTLMPPPPPPPYAPAYVPAYPAADMSLLGDARIMGGIGSILLVLALAPGVGAFLGIAGLVLVFLGFRKISQALAEPSIFENALYGFLSAVIGLVLGAVLIVGALLALVGLGDLRTVDWANWRPTDAQIAGIAVSVIVGLMAVWVALVISGTFVRRAADRIGDRLGVPMFKTAGLVYLIGAALTAIGIGFLLIVLAALLFAIAFFNIGEQRVAVPPPVAPRMVA